MHSIENVLGKYEMAHGLSIHFHFNSTLTSVYLFIFTIDMHTV